MALTKFLQYTKLHSSPGPLHLLSSLPESSFSAQDIATSLSPLRSQLWAVSSPPTHHTSLNFFLAFIFMWNFAVSYFWGRVIFWSEGKVAQSCPTLCDPMDYISPGQNTGVDSLSLHQGIFPTQELNQGLLCCRWILYQLSYQGSPVSPQQFFEEWPKYCEVHKFYAYSLMDFHTHIHLCKHHPDRYRMSRIPPAPPYQCPQSADLSSLVID